MLHYLRQKHFEGGMTYKIRLTNYYPYNKNDIYIIIMVNFPKLQ